MTVKLSSMTYRIKSKNYSFTSEKNGNTNKSIDLLNTVQI